jgi:predicted alpha/beta hydrolase family esterase
MKKLIVFTVSITIKVISFFSSSLAAKYCLYIFTKPRKGRANVYQKNFLEKNLLKNTSLNFPIYNWPGGNKTLLLIHGWESNSARWKPLINELHNLNLNIYAIDAPGHGLNKEKTFNVISYSKLITEVINKTKPDYIVAHSIGTMSAAKGLFNANHKIEKLVLLAPVNNFNFILKEFQRILLIPKKTIESLIRLINIKYHTNPVTYKTSNYTPKDSVLIIHDKQDKIIPYSEALEILNTHQKHILKTTTNLGHRLKSKQVLGLIKDYLSA